MSDHVLDRVCAGSATAPCYSVRVAPSFATELDLWTRMAGAGAALPFQRREWLSAWEQTKGNEAGTESLAVTLYQQTGEPVLALPLVRSKAGLTRIAFADGGLSDYNAPILTRHCPDNERGARQLWTTLLRALPPCDQIRFERMPRQVGALRNPLAMLPMAKTSAATGLSLDMPMPYADWIRAKPRRYRMELGRCARLFDALPGSRFERVIQGRDEVFAALEQLQRARIATLGHRYALDSFAERNFYHAVAATNRDDSVLTALRVGDESVAVLFGLRCGSWFIMLRIAASEEFSRMSPARDLILRTMAFLREDGVTTFDFGLGDYPYKRRLGGEPVDLCDVIVPRSARGWLDSTRDSALAHLRNAPRVHAAMRHVRDMWKRDAAIRGAGAETRP